MESLNFHVSLIQKSVPDQRPGLGLGALIGMRPSLCSFLISKEHLGFNIWFRDIPFFLPFSRHLTPFSSGLGGWEGKNEGRVNSQNLTAFVWVITASLAKVGWPSIHSHARHPKAGSH